MGTFQDRLRLWKVEHGLTFELDRKTFNEDQRTYDMLFSAENINLCIRLKFVDHHQSLLNDFFSTIILWGIKMWIQ